MSISPDLTVGELAASHPAAIRVLDRAGIDYCCGGKRRVADACARAGLAVDELVARIAEAEAEAGPDDHVDWRSAPIDDLVDHIEATHHAFTRSELDRLGKLMTRVTRAHAGTRPELHEVEALFDELAEDLLEHMAKEERILFPHIRASTGMPAAIARGLAAPISVMEVEHETCGGILARLREVTCGYTPPETACASYRALYSGLDALERDLHLHIHLEHDVLFPRALGRGAP
jgi:regulator of cell morphogenesis and NO signaling